MKIILQAAAAAVSLALCAPGGAAETDSAIESSARQSYVFQVYLKGDDIKVESNNGAVVLTGVVAKSFHQSLAQETVVGLPGVRSVANRLRVKESPPAANSDAWLLDRVTAALMFHRSMADGNARVEIKDGTAILRGQAASQRQKDLAAGYVKDVEGVKEVRNQLTVPAVPKKPSPVTYARIDDASITAQIRMTLRYHRSASAPAISVSTDKGAVTLGGKVGTAAEKALAGRLVEDIRGVKSVKNLLTVD